MAVLQARLLGELQLIADGEVVMTLAQPRLQALVVYLLLRRSAPQQRQHLAFIFWPDASESQARNNLRQLLFQLRRALPVSQRWVQSDASSVWWQAGPNLCLDLADFEEALTQAASAERRADRRTTLAALERAVHVYTGDLLPSCYEDWIVPERERLRALHAQALARLIDLLESEREYRQAIPYAQQQLAADPLREESYICLMRLLALTHDRVGALRIYHQCATLLQQELGVAPGEPVHRAYQLLLRQDAVASDGEPAPPAAAMAALVGRRAEWLQLRDIWKRALGGQAQLALIAGEAGIGKTRLADELLNWAGQQGVATARTRAYAAEGRLSYTSIAEWLRSSALAPSLTKLDAVWLSEIARLLPELLVGNHTLASPGPLAEHWQRQRFYQALVRGVLAVRAPLVLQLDDLQWCDQETLEWLHFLLRSEPAAPLLIVGTLRAEERYANPGLAPLLQALQRADQLTELALAPLDAAETARLAARIVGREVTIDESLWLFRETEGNPLFVTEIVQAQPDLRMLAVGDGERSAASERAEAGAPALLPPKVYATIAGRLAQLSPAAGELIGVAATIGRAFTVDVLACACGQHIDALVGPLDELWQRRIIREQGVSSYDFSHDKLRDVAYHELSPIQRRSLHQRVAAALETVHAEDLDPLSAQLAAHYEQAGLARKALGAYERAALAAQRVYAHHEAIQLLRKGLMLLSSLPPGSERDRRELTMQTELGASLVALRGYGAADVLATYQRARSLCAQLGQPASPPILRGLALTHIVRAESQQAYQLGEQILDLAQRANDSVLLVEAEYVQGVALTWQGQFRRANEHLCAALAHYDAQHTRTHLALYAQDPRVVCLIRLAGNLWILGFPERAERAAADALAHARALGHPFTLSYVSYYDTQRQAVMRSLAGGRVAAEATIAICREYQINYWSSLAMICAGWADGMQGAVARGISQIHEGIARREADETRVGQPMHLALLAELYAESGDVPRSLETLAAGFAVAGATGEQWYTAELHRIQGELLLRQLDEAAGEAALLRSLAVARDQAARSFELRAATRLARLWQRQGRAQEAGQLLSPLYHWFSEGLSTPDLVDARALLESLTS